MNVSYIRIFQKVAELQNITKAGNELNLPPSTISKAISRIEEYYKHALFEHTGNKISLNESGMIVSRYFDQILLYENALNDDLNSLNRTESPSVSVALQAATRSFADIMNIFRESYPHVQIKLAFLPFQQTGIKSTSCDLVLYNTYQEQENINSILLHEDRLFLAVSEQHRLAHAEDVSIEELCLEHMVYYSKNPAKIDNIRAFLSEEGVSGFVEPDIIQQTAVIRKMILQNNASVIVPENSDVYSHTPGICFVPIRSSKARLLLYLSWKQGLYISPYAYALRNTIIDYYTQKNLTECTP